VSFKQVERAKKVAKPQQQAVKLQRAWERDAHAQIALNKML